MADSQSHRRDRIASSPQRGGPDDPRNRTQPEPTHEMAHRRLDTVRSAIDMEDYRIAVRKIAEALLDRWYSDADGTSG